MITEIKDLPKGVIGFKASGQIVRQDYKEVVTPVVLKAFEESEKVSLYYQIDMGFTGVDFGAGWEDLSLGLNFLNRWERIAFVSDIGWMIQMTKAFAFLMPTKVRTYGQAEKEEALAWVKGERES